MLATAHSVALFGLAPEPVRVEVQSARGTATFDVVGLPEATVRESRVRVRAALSQIGVALHSHNVTVNLAPADLRKIGSAFDLAIAVGTLAALEVLDASQLAGVLLLGELSLGGTLHGVRGVLPRLIGARARYATFAIVPRANGAEAAIVASAEGLPVFVADDLASVVEHLRGTATLERATPHDPRLAAQTRAEEIVDLADVRGQPVACEALVLAAAGGHDLLFVGPPGAGKTMLARRLPGILPPLRDEEALAVTAIHSAAGVLAEGRGLLRTRPFRAPHHSVSDAGLLGGGDPPRPGELSLAHGGVLFLDELPEFRRPALEGLRQPLEEGTIRIVRARASATFPARPLLATAMNPCPCGYSLGSSARHCRCTPDRVRTYRGRVSGPILDRIDLHLQLPRVELSSLSPTASISHTTEDSLARVTTARAIAEERRRHGETTASTNARLSAKDLARVATLDVDGQARIATAMDHFGLTARAYTKILRIARTLADLEGHTSVTSEHVKQAISYRVLDRRQDDEAA